MVAVAVAGCGGNTASTRASTTTHAGPAATTLPAGWGTLRIPSGAALPLPPGWHLISGDPGTASAALFNRDGTIRAYLNVTPADSNETIPGWVRFRLRHLADEGDRHVRLVSSDSDFVHGSQRESCVTDDYTTSKSKYRELACLVNSTPAGPRTVLVAAAQPNVWPRERAAFQYAINHFEN